MPVTARVSGRPTWAAVGVIVAPVPAPPRCRTPLADHWKVSVTPSSHSPIDGVNREADLWAYP